jgi:hypothetical protein
MDMILKRTLAALTGLKAEYIIVLPDGTKYERGSLKLQEQKADPNRRKRGAVHPIGSIKQYYWPFIKDLQPGQIVEVPFDKYGGTLLVSGISSYATRIWGKRSTMTLQNSKKQVVEVLRAY